MRWGKNSCPLKLGKKRWPRSIICEMLSDIEVPTCKVGGHKVTKNACFWFMGKSHWEFRQTMGIRNEQTRIS